MKNSAWTGAIITGLLACRQETPVATQPTPAPVEPAWHASFKRTFRDMDEAHGAMRIREPDAPKAGSPAPDFELTDPSGGKSVRLSSFIGKSPVVLIFGSHT